MVTKEFETIIESKGKLIDLKLVETWKYRDLIFLFVKREFISKYKQTILGPLWAIIQPFLTTVVFTIIFGSLANLTTLDVITESKLVIPGFLFYMAGTICWSYFSATVTATSNTFIGNSNIMGKVYFPRLVMPISISLANLISFVIQLIMFFIIWLGYMVFVDTDMHLSIYIVLLPFLILQMIMLGMGFGIIVSALTTKYRDLAMLVAFGLQLWQYATPVAYGLSLIPEKMQSIYLLNPISMVIVVFRYAFFGVGYFKISFYLLSWFVTLVIFFLAVILFNKVERTFADTV